jgi:hypothetical protein
MTKAQKENQVRFKKVQAEAKKLKAKNPRLAHTEAVKRAWDIVMGGKRTVTKRAVMNVRKYKIEDDPKKKTKIYSVYKRGEYDGKRYVKSKNSISGVFKFAGYQFEDARQFDIYGNLSYVISDSNGATLFIINGDNKNIAKYSDLLAAYIRKEKGLTTNELSLYKTKIKKFVTQLTKEIQDYNKGKKSTAKPAKSFIPAAAAKAPAKKKVAAKTKPATRKAAVKKQTGRTNIAIDRKIQAKAPGKRISKSGNVYYEARANRSDKGRLLGIKKPAVSKHKDTNSHNVNIKVMSGVGKRKSDLLYKLKLSMNDLDVYNEKLAYWQNINLKDYKTISLRNQMSKIKKNEVLFFKKAIKEEKEHIKELKKLI